MHTPPYLNYIVKFRMQNIKNKLLLFVDKIQQCAIIKELNNLSIFIKPFSNLYTLYGLGGIQSRCITQLYMPKAA